jgi:hypothetical protein
MMLPLVSSTITDEIDMYLYLNCFDFSILRWLVGGGYGKDIDVLARQHAIAHEERSHVWRKHQIWTRWFGLTIRLLVEGGSKLKAQIANHYGRCVGSNGRSWFSQHFHKTLRDTCWQDLQHYYHWDCPHKTTGNRKLQAANGNRVYSLNWKWEAKIEVVS